MIIKYGIVTINAVVLVPSAMASASADKKLCFYKNNTKDDIISAPTTISVWRQDISTTTDASEEKTKIENSFFLIEIFK